jgi:hypothetical protein
LQKSTCNSPKHVPAKLQRLGAACYLFKSTAYSKAQYQQHQVVHKRTCAAVEHLQASGRLAGHSLSSVQNMQDCTHLRCELSVCALHHQLR